MAEIDELLKQYDKKSAAPPDTSDIDHLLKLYPDTAPPPLPVKEVSTALAAPVGGEYGDLSAQPWANGQEAPEGAISRGMREGFQNTKPILTPYAESLISRGFGPWFGDQLINPAFHMLDVLHGGANALMSGGAAAIASGAREVGVPALGRDINMIAQVAPMAMPMVPRAVEPTPAPRYMQEILAPAPIEGQTTLGRINQLLQHDRDWYNPEAPINRGVGVDPSLPSFVPPGGAPVGVPRPGYVPPGATTAAVSPEGVPLAGPRVPIVEPNPLMAGNAEAPGSPLRASAGKTEPPPNTPGGEAIPNGLTPEQVAEFHNIPESLPPMKGEIKTPADAAARADQIVNHFASIGNKEPIPGAVGALPTITGNSGLATLYRAVRDSDTPVPFTTLEKAAKDKAGAALSDLVQTPEALRAGEAAVDAKTAPMRDKVLANKTAADPTPVVAEIDRIMASPSGMSDAVRTNLQKVRDKLVDKDGNILPRATDPEQLYGLDKAIRKDLSPLAAGTTSDARLAAHELMNVQGALRPVINEAAPGFNDYMRTYSEMQRPLDEMRYLQGRNLTNMMDETTLAKVNGMLKDIEKQRNAPGVKLPDSLSPETLNKLREIHDQMQRENFTSTAGKALGSNTFQNLATNSITGKIAGHVGNALVSTGAGMLTDLAAGGGGATGALTGAAASGVLKGYAAKQATKAAAQQEAGRQMLMRELRDRLLNIDNKGVVALRKPQP